MHYKISLHISCESYVFCNFLLNFIFHSRGYRQYRKKVKQGNSPEKDHQNNKQVETTTRNSSNASKPGQKSEIKEIGK